MSLLIAVPLALFLLPAPFGIAVVAAALVYELAEVAIWWRLRGRRAQTGAEALLGEMGEASTALDPAGKVRLRGETWRARSNHPIERGRRVRVVSLDGLTLEVESDRGPGEERGPARTEKGP